MNGMLNIDIFYNLIFLKYELIKSQSLPFGICHLIIMLIFKNV